MARPILGVIVSLILMVIFSFGLTISIWFALGVDGVLLPGSFDGTTILSAWSVLIGILGSLLGGWLCATIGRSRTSLIVFACICFLMGASNALMHFQKADPGPRKPGLSVMEAINARKEPAWYTLLLTSIGPTGSLFAGRRVLCKKK